ncbi:LapA family protein [Salmonella enterica]|nr:LapA family protein [Salmonella enterica]EAX1854486.1 LapA family protein [Salmonella enterica]EAX2792109.1 LapA family protein [Salmonella enterica]EBA2552022.1 LapA family protein [Salmonella enterica]EBA3113264.1 LapA family protein [Salmonella enterica]
MNISYSFTIPESIAVISLAALIMFMAVWILMFFDTWRQRRKYSQLKKQMNLTEKRKQNGRHRKAKNCSSRNHRESSGDTANCRYEACKS